MGEILASNDLHGSSGHGTACAADPETGGWQGYVNRMLPGPNQSVNPVPRVNKVQEDGTTAVFDGDGGMGHIVCKHAVDWAIETAKTHGTACATTRNHFHFGGKCLCYTAGSIVFLQHTSVLGFFAMQQRPAHGRVTHWSIIVSPLRCRLIATVTVTQ